MHCKDKDKKLHPHHIHVLKNYLYVLVHSLQLSNIEVKILMREKKTDLQFLQGHSPFFLHSSIYHPI